MGAKGSGGTMESRGRKVKTAIAVVGSGVPEMPLGMTESVKPFWRRVVDVTAGVAFEQDSETLGELAQLLWRQSQFVECLEGDPLNDDMNRISLAIGRAILVLCSQFGLTPRSRQILLVPKEDVEEEDELEKLSRT